MCIYTYIYIYIYTYVYIYIYIYITVNVPASLRSAQVRAYDDRASCRKRGIPSKRAYALSSDDMPLLM